jgi:hypothetical protein
MSTEGLDTGVMVRGWGQVRGLPSLSTDREQRHQRSDEKALLIHERFVPNI